MPGDEPTARQTNWLQKNTNSSPRQCAYTQGSAYKPTSWASSNVVEVRLQAPRDLSVKSHEDRTVLTYTGHLMISCVVPFVRRLHIEIRESSPSAPRDRYSWKYEHRAKGVPPPYAFSYTLKTPCFQYDALAKRNSGFFCMISQNKQTLFPHTLTHIYIYSWCEF